MKQKIAVIGGGASGVFAAIFAAKHGSEVVIFEHQDRILKKILLTGNGKCNLTNHRMDASCYKSDSDNADLISYTLNQVSPKQIIDVFSKMGMPTKTLRDDYVYPETESSATVVNVLLRQLQKFNIQVQTNTTINKVLPDNGGFFIVTQNRKQHFDKVICAVGGKSYIKTGSDGSFYPFIQQLGIQMSPSYPVLTAMYSDRKRLKTLAGLRVDARATLYIDEQKISSDYGQVQLTDYGISGIPIFQISQEASYALSKPGKQPDIHVCLDFFDRYSTSQLTALINEQFEDFAGLSVEEALIGLFPKKLLEYVLHDQNLHGKKAHEITPKQIKKLVNICKNFDYKITDVKGYDFAQVTGGGVLMEQLDTHFMLKTLPNFYVIGEVLDITGICGGYNLHFAFSSGKIAGIHAAIGK